MVGMSDLGTISGGKPIDAVFLPDFPAIRPKLSRIEEEEKKLDVKGLLNEAISTLETFAY